MEWQNSEMSEGLRKWTLLREDLQETSKHMEKCSASLVVSEVQIKATDATIYLLGWPYFFNRQ